MANEPIVEILVDNTSALAAAPPKNFGSSLSPTAPDHEGEQLTWLLKEKTATLSPPLGQFFINMVLQITTFAAAIAFGIFAIKSIDAGVYF